MGREELVEATLVKEAGRLFDGSEAGSVVTPLGWLEVVCSIGEVDEVPLVVEG